MNLGPNHYLKNILAVLFFAVFSIPTGYAPNYTNAKGSALLRPGKSLAEKYYNDLNYLKSDTAFSYADITLNAAGQGRAGKAIMKYGYATDLLSFSSDDNKEYGLLVYAIAGNKGIDLSSDKSDEEIMGFVKNEIRRLIPVFYKDPEVLETLNKAFEKENYEMVRDERRFYIGLSGKNYVEINVTMYNINMNAYAFAIKAYGKVY